MAPKYPLEQLAVIKQKKLDEAERALEEKRRKLEKEKEKLAQVEQERNKVLSHKNEKLAQLREKLDEGTTTDKIQQMKHYLKVVDEQLLQKQAKVIEQKKQVMAAEQQVEAARKVVFECHKDVEKLSLHRKEWEKEMKVAEEKKEALESDEIGSNVHSLKKRMKHPKKGGEG